MADLQRNQKKLTWNEIAILLHENNTNTSKTGKQCRERWTNQINPEVKRFTEWSKEENEILFSLHQRLGNKWSEISEKLPGRTDNCIKNHFYSVMRGGLRKINVYIENVKRKQVLVKTFKNEILNKILTICEGKNNEKFQLSTQAQELAFTVKKNLVLISLDETEECPKTIEESENLYNLICEFARNCRRKKSKRVNESDFYSDDSEEKEKKKKKNNMNKKTKESESENKEHEDNQQGSNEIKPRAQENKYFEEANDSLNENEHAIISKEACFSLKSEFKEPDNNILGTKSDCQINELERADKYFQIEQPILGSASYNFPLRSNSNYFNFGSINIEASEDWARNSGLLENKNAVTSFINTVPDVTNKKVEFEGENKKGEFDFSNYNNFPIAPSEFEYIFRKEISLYPIPDVAKSYDLEKSFNFSNSIKESPIFLQGPSDTSKLDINLQALFSSSSIPGTPLPMENLANSSGFSMWNGFGKESQEIKLKSTKCDLEDNKLENLNEKGEE